MNDPVATIRRNFKQLSTILLIALMCSLISHASHFDLTSPLADKHRCHLCQNNTDLNNVKLTVNAIEATCYANVCLTKVRDCCYKSAFQTPHLRAPPVFL